MLFNAALYHGEVAAGASGNPGAAQHGDAIPGGAGLQGVDGGDLCIAQDRGDRQAKGSRQGDGQGPSAECHFLL